MNTKLMTAGAVATMGLCAFCAELAISDVKAKQRSLDNGLVDISFDVTSDSNTVSVIFSAMNTATSQMVPMKSVFDGAGNFVGNPAKISPGTGKKLVWNSAIDLGKGFYSDAMVITARATEKQLPPSMLEKLELAEAAYATAKGVTRDALLVFADKTQALQDWLTISGEPSQTYRNFNGNNVVVWGAVTTKAEDDAEALMAQPDAVNSTVLNALTAPPYMIPPVEVTVYEIAKLNLRNAQDNLAIARKAKEIDFAIRFVLAPPVYAYEYIAGAYLDHNGTAADVTMMERMIKNDDPTKGPIIDLAQDVECALDALKGAINAAGFQAQVKADALKIISGYDAAFAATAAKKAARDAAQMERIAATANLTPDQIRAKTAEFLQAVKDADEALFRAQEDEVIRREALAAAKAACGR